MNKLYYTTINYFDENEYEFEAEVIYYVDKDLDSNREFIDDFQIKSIICLNPDENYTPVKSHYTDHCELIINAILDNPGSVAEEF